MHFERVQRHLQESFRIVSIDGTYVLAVKTILFAKEGTEELSRENSKGERPFDNFLVVSIYVKRNELEIIFFREAILID